MSDKHVISGLRANLKQQSIQFKRIEAENKDLREALEEIITESGKVHISNWPAQQQICQIIARKALKQENEDETTS